MDVGLRHLQFVVTAGHHGNFRRAAELLHVHQSTFSRAVKQLEYSSNDSTGIVQVSGDMEVDEFDCLRPCYLLQRAAEGGVIGCVRLLPTTGPTMLRDTFGALFGGDSAPASPLIWESSRFWLNPDHAGPLASRGLAKATYERFAGMIEFGLSRGQTDIATVTDVLMVRVLRRASWPLRRRGEPKAFGRSRAVAGYLGVSIDSEVSIDSLGRIRAAGQLKAPALWTTVVALAG